jgi:hypothetical protein
MVLGYRIQFTKSHTHGQTCYSLCRSLTFKIMVKKVKVFILFPRGAKRMIDLAEQAGAEFFLEQKWMLLCLKLLYT